MESEIRQQPELYDHILTTGKPEIERVAAAIAETNPRFVLFIARGTSDHAALYAKYLVETRLGLPAGLASPSATTVYDAHPRMEGVLCIAISQSGESPDVVMSTTRAGEQGAVTLAITNDPESDLARAAAHRLPLMAGHETAVAATKTYTAELLTSLLLVDALAGRQPAGYPELPGQARAALMLDQEVADIAARYRFVHHLLVTSRGYNSATASETALKLMEAARVPAHAFSGADLMHGPMAMVDRGFPVIAISPKGPGGEAMKPALERLTDQGADLLLVGDANGAIITGPVIPLPPSAEYVSPLLAIIPLQLLALELARQRGFDPDQPVGLTKVTKTV
ncbi:MAG TPA: SIS domain-containing protein [Chloroflexota bacterium]|nr:SIS domain-containing protein [Chloroflexota bacterium]